MVERLDLKQVIGRSPDLLTLDQRKALVGKWAAYEMYTPQTLPLRRIEAIGDTPAECLRQLRERGLDARNFELEILLPAY